MFIKKIFEKNYDDETHRELLKFGKGEFKNKYVIEAKNKDDFYTIKTSSEFANYFVKKGLENYDKKIKINGVIISTYDLDIPFIKEKKQYLGIKKFIVEGEIAPSEVIEIMNKYPKIFFALSFSREGYSLKIKPKAPKSPKPNIKENGEEKAQNFCTLNTNKKNFVEEFFFDCPKFKEIKINHTIKIDEIIYPENFQKMKPEEIRENSKRKGKIIREIILDGKKIINETNFLV